MRVYTEAQRIRRRKWLAADTAKRRQKVIEYLGGVCVRCGSTEDLETDHVNSAEKSFDVSRNLNRRWEVLVTELDKCQLLCHSCHREKTVECGEAGGGGNRLAEVPHGTFSGYVYWKCRCESCRQAYYDRKVALGYNSGKRGRYNKPV